MLTRRWRRALVEEWTHQCKGMIIELPTWCISLRVHWIVWGLHFTSPIKCIMTTKQCHPCSRIHTWAWCPLQACSLFTTIPGITGGTCSPSTLIHIPLLFLPHSLKHNIVLPSQISCREFLLWLNLSFLCYNLSWCKCLQIILSAILTLPEFNHVATSLNQDLDRGQSRDIVKTLILRMIGFVVNVPFLITIGVKTVKNVINLALLKILCRDLKTGSVPNAEILIMLVEWNVIAVSVLKVLTIDFEFHSPKSLFLFILKILNSNFATNIFFLF